MGGHVIFFKYSYRKFNIDWIVLIGCLLFYSIFTVGGYSISSFLVPLIDFFAIILTSTFAVLFVDEYRIAFFTGILTGILDFLIYLCINQFFHQVTLIYHVPIDFFGFMAFLILFIMGSFMGIVIGLFLNKNTRRYMKFSRSDNSKTQNISNDNRDLYDALFNNLDSNKELDKVSYCSNCGNKSDSSVNFCAFCGKKL